MTSPVVSPEYYRNCLIIDREYHFCKNLRIPLNSFLHVTLHGFKVVHAGEGVGSRCQATAQSAKFPPQMNIITSDVTRSRQKFGRPVLQTYKCVIN